jgi:hypothetical protein
LPGGGKNEPKTVEEADNVGLLFADKLAKNITPRAMSVDHPCPQENTDKKLGH